MGRRILDYDWLILFPALILTGLGLVTLLSVDPRFFFQQLSFTLIGIILFLLFSKIDFTYYHYLDKHLFVLCNLLLLLSFLGPEIRGATRWLELGSFRFQPSELIKPLLLISWASIMGGNKTHNLRSYLIQLVLLLIPFLLIYRQPDLGNSIILAVMWITLVILGGIPISYIIVTLLTGILILPLGLSYLQDYQKLRIVTFFNPAYDPQGAGYNAIQSLIAIGSGQLWGRGFGRGTQSLLKFLPERHTDFIFATFVEEFGFFGGSIIIILFGFLLWQVLNRAKENTSNQIVFLFIVGLFIQLLIQVIINIGMNLGIVPITGITLPFVSYGGSSLLSTWISLGILTSSLRHRRL